MAADGELLKGEVNEHPESQDKDVEALLMGLIQALVRETKGNA